MLYLAEGVDKRMSSIMEQETFHVAVAANERYMPGALVALAGVAAFAQMRREMFCSGYTPIVSLSNTFVTRPCWRDCLIGPVRAWLACAAFSPTS